MHRPFKISILLALALWLVLLVGSRCWNSNGVFVNGHTFFVDPDCYSRMTRVARIYESPTKPVHFHEFENWPTGVRPHTTAPFDYLTAGLALVMRPFSAEVPMALDRAGAWISPLLAVLTGLALWVRAGKRRYAALAFFAISPILVQGAALGRPDHQSLALLFVAIALRAEMALMENPSRAWAIAGGVAWGLALWVSLYEPLVLFILASLLSLALLRRAFFCRERGQVALSLAAVLLLGLAVDGWPSAKLDPAVLVYFANWSRSIGELNHTSFSTLAAWVGWLLFAAPFILGWRIWRERDAKPLFWLGLLSALVGLTLWQARWGYFLALVFALTLPSLLGVFRRGWVAWVVLIVSLWPVGREWDRMLDSRQSAAAAEQRVDNLGLYEVAMQLRAAHRQIPVMAPWWQSPALAYWSGQPCVAGSSHESLPGTVDSARVFMSPAGSGSAEAILAHRGVECIVAYDADRVESLYSTLLGEPAPKESLARRLYEKPNSAPRGFQLLYANPYFRLFSYQPAQ